MPPRSYNFNPPTNPFLQIVYFVVGGVLLIGAVLMGAVILAVALGLAIVLGLIVYVRVWWLRRKLARRGGRTGSDSDVFEVEYTVLDEREQRNRREGGD